MAIIHDYTNIDVWNAAIGRAKLGITDVDLGPDLAAETAARIAGDSNEAAARIAADNTERVARIAADANEAAIRAAADAALEAKSVPAGGNTGQSLTKASNTDYDMVWATVGDDTLTWMNL